VAGNALLREMEPPRHDNWNPDHPEKNAHKKTASEFTSFIRDCIQKLAPSNKEKVLAIPELANYLPDDEDSADESFDGEDVSKKESFQRQPEAKKINGRKTEISRRPFQPDKSRPGDGDMDIDMEGIVEGPEGTDAGGDGGGGGEGGEGSGGGEQQDGKAGANSGHHGKNAKPAIPIRGRVFVSDLATGTYQVIAQPLKPVKGDVLLTLKAIADDATGSAVRIAAASDVDGLAIPIPKLGVIGPVQFKGKTSLILSITLVEPRKLAMEVEAHEAE